MRGWKGAEIRDLWARMKLTQEELAQNLGVTTSTVNRWENGKSTPSRLACAVLTRLLESVAEEAVTEGALP